MVKWRFPSNDYGENKGINDSGVSQFRGTPLKSLAREICQNSLDATVEEKIKVEFNMFSIESNKLPGRDVLKNTFERCLDFWKVQKGTDTKDFFTTAIKEIEKEQCTFLRISDFNTRGLTGSKGEINTNWTNLTKSSGVSDKRGTAGGSFGIGKFAPFACSLFSTIFYSTYDEEGIEASQGVARLVTFTREDGENTQGIGYFGEEKNTPVYEQLKLEPGFDRKPEQYGTDIYIAGYKFAGETWKTDIIISILDGFLGAIWNEKLEVIVGDVVINKESLDDLIEEYHGALTGYTDKYYEVLRSDKTAWKVENLLGLGEVKLGILLGDPDAPKRVAMIRQTGMKIMDKDRLPGHVPFTGIMFINGDEINTRLRLMENPEHTEWQPDRAGNKMQAQTLLKKIHSFIRNWIEELVSNSTEDSIDAVGVGNFIPDMADDAKDTSKEEIISDKVLDVEIKKVPRKAKSMKQPGDMEKEDEVEKDGHMEPDGTEEEWFHNGGHTVTPGPKPGDDAHQEEGGSEQAPKKISVGIEKFISICVDKERGKYVLMIVPDNNGTDGIVELYLSAETQNYEAPIQKASLIAGSGTVTVSKNKIKGFSFAKGQAVRVSIELDFYDYCSMEVKMYATQK